MVDIDETEDGGSGARCRSLGGFGDAFDWLVSSESSSGGTENNCSRDIGSCVMPEVLRA